MKVPYLMSCRKWGVGLFPLKNGMFQMMKAGKIASMVVDIELALVEHRFADYLESLHLPNVEIADAIIYDSVKKLEIHTHRRLLIEENHLFDPINHIDTSGERLFLVAKRYLFVTPQLKKRLAATDFRYLTFSKGTSNFLE